MTPRYLWRRLNERQREELLAWRKERGYPWHSPPHRDWPWSSASEYLAQTGVNEAKHIWREYPIGNYGKGWDEPEM